MDLTLRPIPSLTPSEPFLVGPSVHQILHRHSLAIFTADEALHPQPGAFSHFHRRRNRHSPANFDRREVAYLRSQEKGVFRRVFFANMYASLVCGALSAKCTAGPHSPGHFWFPWA